jgi:hypothetical protein
LVDDGSRHLRGTWSDRRRPRGTIDGKARRGRSGIRLGRPKSLVVEGFGDAPQADLGFRHWGYVPNDPQAVFDTYVEDKARFLRMMTRDLTQQILNEHPVANLVNPGLGFGLLVPNNYGLTQAFDNQHRLPMFVATLTNDDPNVPYPLNQVKIYAWRVPPEELAALAAQVADPKQQ